MAFILPQKIGSIIAVLNNAGFPAHIVGGCVRDLVMGKEPHDWDITTSARPHEVKSLFGKTWDTGLKHGTVTVNLEGQIAEITTWRTDATYIDHRHPEHVEFTNSLADDLSRRDFTMNAMAYHPDEGIIDPFGGMDDIRGKKIRSVGNPMRRFSEDALRMLRAVRFSAQLGFDIDGETYAAVKKLHVDITYISAERVRGELDKIMESANPGLISLIWETGMSREIFPEIDSLPELCKKVSCSIKLNPDSRILILTALLHGAFAAEAANKAFHVLHRLKYDNRLISSVINALRAMDAMSNLTDRNRRMASYCFTPDAARLGEMVLIADHGQSELSLVSCASSEAFLKLEITGSDLINARLGAGKEIGENLRILALCLFEKPELNDRDTLMALATAVRDKFHR